MTEIIRTCNLCRLTTVDPSVVCDKRKWFIRTIKSRASFCRGRERNVEVCEECLKMLRKHMGS